MHKTYADKQCEVSIEEKTKLPRSVEKHTNLYMAISDIDSIESRLDALIANLTNDESISSEEAMGPDVDRVSFIEVINDSAKRIRNKIDNIHQQIAVIEDRLFD